MLAVARWCTDNPKIKTKQGVVIINKKPKGEELADDQDGHCDDNAAKAGEPAPVMLLCLCFEGFWILVGPFSACVGTISV